MVKRLIVTVEELSDDDMRRLRESVGLLRGVVEVEEAEIPAFEAGSKKFLSSQQLAELKRLELRATEGPWQWEAWGDDREDFRWLVAPPHTREGGASEMFPDLGNDLISAEEDVRQEDRDFIVAARNAMSALIAEVEQHRKQRN